jgi:hypothetical protein
LKKVRIFGATFVLDTSTKGQKNANENWNSILVFEFEKNLIGFMQEWFKPFALIMLSGRLQGFNTLGVTVLPLKGNLVPILRAQRWITKVVTHVSLQREKLWIFGTEEILILPCSLFLRMTALMNLLESNSPSPHGSILLTQNLHWMLWIG